MPCCVQVQWAAVTELLQPEEERLMQTRAALEGVCVTPVVATALSNAQAVLSALQGNLPLPRRGEISLLLDPLF